MIHALTKIESPKDAIALFPTSVAQIKARTQAALDQARTQLDAILAIPDDQRTYENTAKALDILGAFSNAAINGSAISTLDLVNPDTKIRDAAREAVLETQNFYIDHISSNRDLYQGFKAYVDGNAKNENLNDEQKRFLKETMDDFERAGLNLSEEKLDQVKKIKKDLVNLALEFDKNIAEDQGSIAVAQQDLKGLSADFIESLKKTDDGKYILTIDYPTYTQVMENCSNGQTRQDLWNVYMNRAYPKNKKLLEDIIAKRFELAQLLGFDTYAALELHNQMVLTPARAQQFLDELNQKAQKKAVVEFKELTQKLPESVSLTADGKLKPWDIAYLKNQYKKTTFSLDENLISEYFPMQHTVDSLLKIYEEFFNLTFKQVPVSGLWDSDVKMIEVIDNNHNQTAGYLFLDLFPRANKYSHACEHTIIPVTYIDNKPNLGVAIVIANFPKPMADKPALLHFKDVNTFFHEFGHAMHALLGRTEVVSFAGTSVRRDFVEMPSQMLEEWLWDPAILKMVSSHYQTGQSLPDDLIAAILKSRTYDSGFYVTRQLYLANISLSFFNNGPALDLDATLKDLYTKFMQKTQFDPRDHFYASFGHLTGYGAQYYGYMWSKVFAVDLFDAIKKEGLLNPIVGRRYVDTVIGKGGSQDPNDILKNFLGREPNQAAFLHEMGFAK